MQQWIADGLIVKYFNWWVTHVRRVPNFDLLDPTPCRLHVMSLWFIPLDWCTLQDQKTPNLLHHLCEIWSQVQSQEALTHIWSKSHIAVQNQKCFTDLQGEIGQCYRGTANLYESPKLCYSCTSRYSRADGSKASIKKTVKLINMAS